MELLLSFQILGLCFIFQTKIPRIKFCDEEKGPFNLWTDERVANNHSVRCITLYHKVGSGCFGVYQGLIVKGDGDMVNEKRVEVL